MAQVNGVWSIPSHSDYPADAKEHMAQAATALLDLKILSVASNNAGDQELYGVVTPDPQKLRPGATGVGTRVTLKDDKDDTAGRPGDRQGGQGPADACATCAMPISDQIYTRRGQDRQVLDQVRGLDRKRPAQAQRLRRPRSRSERLLDASRR